MIQNFWVPCYSKIAWYARMYETICERYSNLQFAYKTMKSSEIMVWFITRQLIIRNHKLRFWKINDQYNQGILDIIERKEDIDKIVPHHVILQNTLFYKRLQRVWCTFRAKVAKVILSVIVTHETIYSLEQYICCVNKQCVIATY